MPTPYRMMWVVNVAGFVFRCDARRLPDGRYKVKMRRGKTILIAIAPHAFETREEAEAFRDAASSKP